MKTPIPFLIVFLGILTVFPYSDISGAVFRSRRTGDWNNSNTWHERVSGSWENTSNIPGSGDNTRVRGHTITVTSSTSCNSLRFYSNNGSLYINNGITLAVANDITARTNGGSNRSYFISGTGTITCGTLNVGHDVGDLSTGTRTTSLTSDVSNFVISGNLIISSNTHYYYYYRYNNAVFNFSSGTITVNGTVSLLRESSNNDCTFTMDTGNENGTLVLNGATPFSFSAILGSFTLDLSGNSTLVRYNHAGDQTVYGTTYTGLTISNSGVKTINRNTINTGTLTIESTGTVGSALTVNQYYTLTNNGSIIINSGGLTASGSLVNNGSITGSGNVTYNRWMDNNDHHLFSAPVTNSSIATFESTYSVNVLQWDEPNGAWNSASSDGTFTQGKGYAWDNVSGGSAPVTFTGTLATGSFTYPVTAPWVYTTYPDWTMSRAEWSGGGWNLLGNPYTSALNISSGGSSFITVNGSNKFDPNYTAVYLYGSDGSYYYVGTPIGWASPHGSDYVQVGQGFLVMVYEDAVTFAFNSGMQSHQTSVPLRNPSQTRDPWPGVLLKVAYGDQENATLVVYNDKMTKGLDPSYDVGFLSSGLDMEVYTRLVEDNEIIFTRQALPLEDYETNIIPVGIDSENGGEVTFSADIVPLEGRRFILEDSQMGTFTYLAFETYTVTIPPGTYGTGRFYIHSVISTGIEDPIPGKNSQLDIHVWTVDNMVNIKGELSDQARGAVYDLMGRLIVEDRLNGGELNTLNVPSYLKGVYLLRVIDGEKVATQKVVF